jgi:putative membrane protein
MSRFRVSCLLVATLAAPAFAEMRRNSALPANVFAKTQSSPLAPFAREAAIGGMSEVELGRLAVERATDPSVKAFAQHMVDDHSKANVELQMIAAQAGITLPGQIDAAAKAAFTKLSALSGPTFDRAYIADMVKDHKTDIALFEKASRMSGDSALKKFAADKLPTLREHLQIAEHAQAHLGKGADRAEPALR